MRSRHEASTKHSSNTHTRAMLKRGRKIYASGTAFTSGHRTKLLLIARRALEPGTYLLTLRRWRHGTWSSTQQVLTIG